MMLYYNILPNSRNTYLYIIVTKCGNLTQVLEQLHSQELPITHANYSQRRLNNGAKH